MTPAVPGMRTAYDASALAWADGPAAAYESMAEVLVAQSMTPLRDARVLDLGAGTGAASRAARRAGARWVVGVDIAPAMLHAGIGWDSAVVADATLLPFATGQFDLVVAACCLGHLPDPQRALIEARRVAPAVVASAFQSGWTHPGKSLVDTIAAGYGFTTPEWYVRLKAEVEPQVDDPVSLAGLASAAGYRRVEVTTQQSDVGVHSPAQLTTWRLGMAHLAPFIATLADEQQHDLRSECEEALVGAPPLVIPLVVLSAGAA